MKKHDFALVELIVMVAVLAVLAGLLGSAVVRLRAGAVTAQCLDNQKTSLKAIAAYAADHGNTFAVRVRNASWGTVLSAGNYVGESARSALKCPLLAPAGNWSRESDEWLLHTFGMPRTYPEGWEQYYGDGLANVDSRYSSVIDFNKIKQPKMIMSDTYNAADKKQSFEWRLDTAEGKSLGAFVHGGQGSIGRSDGSASSMTPQQVKEQSGGVVKEYYNEQFIKNKF